MLSIKNLLLKISLFYTPSVSFSVQILSNHVPLLFNLYEDFWKL